MLITRDMLGFAKTRKEAKAIISQEKIMMDGKVQRDELFPAGLMDVISIPDAARVYRILPSEKGLTLHPIEKDEAEFKLCRIEDKTIVNGGHVQLNLHDGRNVLIQAKAPEEPGKDIYHTMDTLKLSVPNQEIVGHIKLAKGAPAIIIGGKNAGRHGKIVDIEERAGQKRRKLLVTIENTKGKRFQTTLDFIFVVGDAEPSISLPEDL